MSMYYVFSCFSFSKCAQFHPVTVCSEGSNFLGYFGKVVCVAFCIVECNGFLCAIQFSNNWLYPYLSIVKILVPPISLISI